MILIEMKKYLKKILSLFMDQRSSIILIFLYMVIILVINYFLPFLSRRLIDDGFINSDKNCVIRFSLYILGLNIAIILFNILKRKQAVKMNINVVAKLQRAAFRHLLGVKISYFNDNNATDMYQFIDEDIKQISSLVSDSTINALTAVFSAIGGGVALFMIDWRLGIAVVLFTPLKLLFSELFAKKNNSLIFRTIRLKRGYSRWYGETIIGVRDIRLFGLKKQKKREMDEQLEELNKMTYDCSMLLTYNSQIQVALVEILKAMVYILAAYFMLGSDLTVGSVVAFQAYMLLVSESEGIIIGLFFSVASLLPHIRRYYDFIDEPEEYSAKEIIDFSEGSIEFKNVSFSYDETEKKIFNNIEVCFPRGSKTVIVGDNGVGKTTFLNLLLSLLEPVSGEILVNGKNIHEADLEEYRQLFSVVSQDIFLFSDSIRNNICLGKDISQEKLERIVRKVNLEGVIEKYGFDYQIEQNGSNLSGGQKQKIALARALALDRPIMLFDEATANLDRATTKNFISLFNTILKNTTVICVSHSDEIIEYFDSRVVFSDGGARIESINKS